MRVRGFGAGPGRGLASLVALGLLACSASGGSGDAAPGTINTANGSGSDATSSSASTANTSAGNGTSTTDLGTSGGGGSSTSGSTTTSSAGTVTAPDSMSDGTSVMFDDADLNAGTGGGASASSDGRDPVTCEEAEEFRTYLGCEYFPTVLGNVVHPEFDYAVIVANASDEAADVHVDGPGGFSADATVAPGQAATLYLPWVDELKGPSLALSTCSSEAFAGSVFAAGSAYHLTSTRPVAAYQFNPLQFRAAGGAADKVWTCVPGDSPLCECNSYTNDASLLLPVNALTGNYIAATWRDQGNVSSSKPGYITLTAVEDATEVTVKLGPLGELQAGSADSGIPAAVGGDVFSFTMNRGDVAELVAVAGTDLSGSQIQTTDEKPIQVMTGSSSATVPGDSVRSSDHIEELVAPAEALGKDYVVTVPTGPYGLPVLHVVRLYGYVDTTFSYHPAKPDGAPDALAAGQVGEFEATVDFQVQGSASFAVGSFLAGGQLLDPEAPATNSAGDPSQSFATAVPQYRDKYVFLAPVDYEGNFVDVVAPSGATLNLDGLDLDASTAQTLAGVTPEGDVQEFQVYRVQLDGGPSGSGSHVLTASSPVGVQVVGYGRFTSYQYPGGLNLNLISDPPITILR